MNHSLALLFRLLVIASGACLAIAAGAQENVLVKPAIPADAPRVLLDAYNGVLSVDGVRIKTSAALQIRDQHNKLHLTQSMNGRYIAVMGLDGTGAVNRIWLLARKE